MIDEAADLNNKKQNSGIGFLNRDGENNSEGGLDEEEDREDLLEAVIPKKPTRTLDSDSEEEIKKDQNNPELAHAKSGLSASHKIAEMGLNMTGSE